MPIYTCTIAESTLSADTKRALAGEIATAATPRSLPSRRNECFRHFQGSPAHYADRKAEPHVCPEPGGHERKLDRRKLTKTANAFRRATH